MNRALNWVAALAAVALGVAATAPAHAAAASSLFLL